MVAGRCDVYDVGILLLVSLDARLPDRDRHLPYAGSGLCRHPTRVSKKATVPNHHESVLDL